MNYAIVPLIIATIISVFFLYRIDKKIPTIPILGAVVVTIFGGLAIVFDNKIFFYMKPTIINVLFALVLIYGKIFLKKPLLKKLFEGSIHMTDEGWNILNKRWIYFFIFLALLNELVWRTQTEEFWVQFKVFGLLPITLIFTIMQVTLIQKHRIDQ
jgi:intracellular septation protein